MSKDMESAPMEYEQAKVKQVRTISKIWLIPIVAFFIGAWMVYYQWDNQGPLITIEFNTAAGIEAGKTKIKTRNVDIGVVKKIELTQDLNSVIVTARMNKDVDPLLRPDTQFWIVSPRVSLSGVSGLGTILSGPYINMAPSIANEGLTELGLEQQTTDAFVALDSPPVTPAGTPGLHLTLNSESQFAYKEGDPVIYKGIKVGEFEDIYFNFEERIVYYNTFIEAPYHKLITSNTKFWDISGIQMELGANGVKVSTGSLETLLTNGVTFGVPEGMPPGQQITERSYYDIHTSYELASEQRYKLRAEYAILVKDTIRGLKVGAPVEYRGLVIGKVLSINAIETQQNGLLEKSYDIPVIIGIQPGRVQQPDNEQGLSLVKNQTDLWIRRGLRASLKTGNLLTGALFVDLQHYPDLPIIDIPTLANYPVIPTMTSEFSEITAKVTAILDNINDIKLNKLSDNANNMLAEIGKTATALKSTADNVDKVLHSIQEDKVSTALAKTLENLSKLSQDFSSGSKVYNKMDTTMQTLQHTLKELQPLLRQLNSRPNSLIFTDAGQPNYEPKARSIQIMRHRTNMKAFSTLLVLLLLWACSSPPEAINYYLLHTPNDKVLPHTKEQLVDVIVLEQLEIANYLNQSNLVMQMGQHELYFSRQNVWGEALQSGLYQALLQDLNQESSVTYVAASSPYATNNQDHLRIKLEHFHATDASSVVTSGKYWINLNDGQISEYRFYFELPLEQDGYSHSVKKLRELVTLIAKQIPKDMEASLGNAKV